MAVRVQRTETLEEGAREAAASAFQLSEVNAGHGMARRAGNMRIRAQPFGPLRNLVLALWA